MRLSRAAAGARLDRPVPVGGHPPVQVRLRVVAPQSLGGCELLLAEHRPAALVLASSQPVEGAFGFALFSCDDEAIRAGNIHNKGRLVRSLRRHQTAAGPGLQERAKLHFAYQAVRDVTDRLGEAVPAAPQAPSAGVAVAQEIASPELELPCQPCSLAFESRSEDRVHHAHLQQMVTLSILDIGINTYLKESCHYLAAA